MIATSHLVLLVLVLILTVAAGLLWRENRRLRAAFGRPMPQANVAADDVQILQRVGDDWLLHSTRPEGHRDIAEALDTPGLADFTVSGWFQATSKGAGNNNDRFFAFITDANNHFQLIVDDASGKYAAELTRGGVATIAAPTYGAYDPGTMVHLAYIVSGSAGSFYRNGVSVSAGAPSTIGAGAVNAFHIARRPDANATTYYKGVWDEIRISQTARSAAWITTEYNNQNAPGTFWIAGTPGPAGGSTQQQLSMLGCGA